MPWWVCVFQSARLCACVTRETRHRAAPLLLRLCTGRLAARQARTVVVAQAVVQQAQVGWQQAGRCPIGPAQVLHLRVADMPCHVPPGPAEQ